MIQPALISAQNITVYHNGVATLDSVSLDIQKNDFITIIGPNGAGKSTLLKCLTGLVTPDKGKITRLKHLKIGYVPQQFVPEKTVPISVQDFLKLCRHYRDNLWNKVIEQTGISALLDKSLHHLSGGEMQKILLARALLAEPDLLVLDEPAQNLDISGQLAFYKLLDHLYAQGDLAIVMISHDLHLVLSSSKHVICLFHHICCSGEPSHVTQSPEFTRIFGDDMAKLLSVYHHHHNHNH